MKRTSIFKDRKSFDQHNWLITLFNAGDPRTGHAALLIEGEDSQEQLQVYRCEIFAKPFEEYLKWYLDASLSPGQPSVFQGFFTSQVQTAITPMKDQVVCYVVLKSYKTYPQTGKPFDQCTSHTWSVNKGTALGLIGPQGSVTQEKNTVDVATRTAILTLQQGRTPDLDQAGFRLFKLYGNASTLPAPQGQSNDGINCVNWCEHHLRQAQIPVTSNISDSFAAKPEWHAGQHSSGPCS